jgi:hypothetical protein
MAGGGNNMRLRLHGTQDAQSTLSLITLHLSAPLPIPPRHRPTVSFRDAGAFGAHTGSGLGLGGLGLDGGRIFGICHFLALKAVRIKTA